VTTPCRACGEPVGATWTIALGANWHPEHFRCAGCERPIGEGDYVPIRGAPWHRPCFEAEFIACFCCGDHVRRGAASGTSAMPYCPGCSATVVTRPKAARLFQGVEAWAIALGMGFALPPPLKLVRRPGLIGRLAWGACLGLTKWSTLPGGSVVVHGIQIVEGLPEVLFQATVAHELTHAWLAPRLTGREPAPSVEGLCELVSFHCLEALGGTTALRRCEVMTQNPDPVYGEGLRRSLDRTDGRPIDEVLAGIARSGRLP
jgi:hypothetical protein